MLITISVIQETDKKIGKFMAGLTMHGMPIFCGGFYDGPLSRKCRIFNPGSHNWDELAKMTTGRKNFGLIKLSEDSFWAVGKRDIQISVYFSCK